MTKPVVLGSLIAWLIGFLELSIPTAWAQDVAQEAPESAWQTIAELSEFRDTASEAEVASYLRRLATQWDGAELTTIGNTVEGRPLWALVVEPQGESQPPNPITVLMLGGIHSGECDGKEALLALAADMAEERVDDDAEPWWNSLRLIFVPNFNADGNERRGVLHRPGQAGPEEGMGVRETAQGLDLNRDFMKLDSPEVRSLVAALHAYDVDVLIDTHTTNGSLHRYQLTYDIPHNPATPPAIDAYLRRELIPAVTKRVANDGFSTFYYGNFDQAHRRWETYGHEPRYSTEYMGLRGRIGILVESYSYASYQTRVLASYAFIREVLRKVAEDSEQIRAAIDGSQPQPDSDIELTIALQAKLAKTADEVLVKGYQRPDGSPPTSPFNQASAAQHIDKDYSVTLWNRTEGTKIVKLPAAYAIAPQYAWAVDRLRRHGAEITQLTAPTSLPAEQITVDQLERLPEFQRHKPLQLTTSALPIEAELPAGTFVVPTRQPLGMLIAHLLEPESDDGLARWNFFDPDLAAGEVYPVKRLLELPAAETLQAVETIQPSEQLTLENLMRPGRTANYSDAVSAPKWLKDSSAYVLSKNDSAYAVDAQTGAMRPMTELRDLRNKLASLQAFSNQQATDAATPQAFSDDWQHALVPHRRDLYFFDAVEQVARQLTHSPDEDEQLATLSPQGTHVAFVRSNNLWTVNCATTELKQLTHDGSPELLNGILDWVYQEELYGRGNFKAFWWSPDGQRIAFLQLDQTPVPTYQVADSINYGQSLEATRYPKAGEPLPTARVWIVDVATGELVEADLSKFPAADRLVARVTWSPAGELWLQVFNRVQNRQDLVRVDATNGSAATLFTEVSSGWIEVRGTPEFLPNGDFLWLSDLPTGRTHLYRVSLASGQKSQLTSGEWDVSSLLGVAADHKRAFVTGNTSSAIEQQLMAIDVESGVVEQITAAPGTHQPSVDHSGNYYIDVFSNIDTPPFAAVYSIDGGLLRVVDAPVTDRHEFLNIRSPQLVNIPVRDGLELQGMVLLPTDIDLSKPERQLPVLFHVYGGPQAPTIRNRWQAGNYWWHQLLCQHGFAVVLCDNRASAGRGVKDTWTIRGDMGRVELQDLEDAVAWVAEQPWADPQRVGVWGWSYGGYFTSYAMTHSHLFKAGIAGAPVTDWRNYDAIYTERYMDLPQANAAGYQSSSTVEAAHDLHGRLLIIHGERDDNVHLSNSLQLAYALQKANKQFDMMVYPKNRHGVVDSDQRYHMYRMMTQFLELHLKN
ncbi:MAG: DPP IV N-terminal domain-containing protein [Pirellulaceae bacterium]